MSLLIIMISFVTLSCVNNTGQNTKTSSIEKGATVQKEEVEFSEKRIQFLYDSLIGNMPREEITPYIDSLQGKTTPDYKTQERWKLKETEAIAMLYDWNEKHNNHTASHTTIPYADYVDFYDERKELEEITAIKTAMFKRYPDFHQEILPSSIKTKGEESIKRIEFTKKVMMNGKTKRYNSFLEFGGTHGAFFIIGEGDMD